jgi:phospholipase C
MARRTRATRSKKKTSSKTRKTKAVQARGQADAAVDPFRHVVVLMLENRSFDHVLGALRAEIPGLEGVDASSPHSNLGPDGKPYPQQPGASAVVDPDPKHESANVLNQLDDANGRFVKDYARSYPATGPGQWQEVMAYHAAGTLPSLHALARAFVVCDHWFCSVPGPTWTNRLFAMSGTSQGRVEMPSGIFHANLHRYDQPSLFRRVEQAGRRCAIYVGDFPLALLLADRRSLAGARSFRSFSSFAKDCANEAAFPDLAWIEPSYLGDDANDDHPPHDVMRGQALVASAYESIRANDSLFRSTLLVVVYDEHGGFYDHISPGPAVPPDARHEEYAFDRFGLRVPVVLVSPWLAHGVVKTELDHTALLRGLQVRWQLGKLGNRVDRAPDLFGELGLLASPRRDVPSLAAPRTRAMRAAAPRTAVARPRLTANEEAIVAFSAWLDTQTPGAPKTKMRAAQKAMRAPEDSRAVAKARARAFLLEKGARL